MGQYPEQLMGKLAHRFCGFPLLLKFLDACEMLSVQVHPSDAHPDMLPRRASAEKRKHGSCWKQKRGVKSMRA
jgi:mannose-6-phosphate isomerase class I